MGADAARRGELVCPVCGAPHPSEERFCADCGMLLVMAGDRAAGEAPASPAHARARKVRPELARGELVRVAGGRNQAEAELIHGLLLEEGIPSLVRRSAAFDVPDFLAAGQRDVLVPESGAAAARALLTDAELVAAPPALASALEREALPSRAVRIGAAIVLGALLAALVAWLLLGLAA